MNRAGKIAIGCLLAPIGLVVIGVFFFMALRMAGVPDPQVTTRKFEQAAPFEAETALESVRRPDQDPVGTDFIAPGNGLKVRVLLDLEEGRFDVLPGPASEGFRVEGEYDEATYELTQKYDVQKDGTPVYVVGFRSKVSWLRRLAQDGSFDDEDIGQNTVTVQLPLGTPMDLAVRMAKAEAHIDLSGLSLASLSSELRMGEYRMITEEDNPLQMEEFATKCTMGEFRFEGISRMHPAVIRAGGSMGEIDLDLGGPLVRDTEIISKLQMGSLRLNLPENAFWDPSSFSKVNWGEMSGSLSGRGAEDPELAPRLRIEGSIFMGELVVDSYRPRASLQTRGRN